MPKRKLTRLEWMLFAAPLLALLPLALHAKLVARRDEKRLQSCQLNLRHIAEAMQLYAADYDAKLPPASIGGTAGAGWRFGSTAASPVGWADVLTPYLAGSTFFICPLVPLNTNGGTQPKLPDYTAFWMNANLSGVKKSSLAFPAATLLLGDGSDGIDKTDATYSKTSLPAAWIADPSSPAYRHLGGANYLFADGHVAWLKPDAVNHFGGRNDAFAVK